ncbi:3-oxoacid CoA-transferase subunit A [Amycolatopsis sp. RM579]|uniref:3-oxoacid CoA-transferase subunit A n=1 Tax=Amycolatopsis pithecellobii TaxID=664692 RepID=A0A6N7Z092_9PSEU|nr:3-oxoacid CoA-transferase subunit A [Amycolatopsis pithecellobii]
MDKIRPKAADALDSVHNGASIAIGGFGQSGVPLDLIDALCDRDVRGLHIIANNGGRGLPGERGIGRLLAENRVSRFSCSFPVNPAFFERYFSGEVEIELVPQGTLAERLRAGGSGIGGFYTPTAAGTVLADGGFVVRYGKNGEPEKTLAQKERRVIDGRTYVLESPLRPDFALVKAHRADRYGNLRFRLGARNFNPLAAMAAKTTIAQADQIAAALDPDDIHLPGPFVDRVVATELEPAR